MLGPNGAGKTTAVEIFEGLRSPDSGEVEVLGTAGGAMAWPCAAGWASSSRRRSFRTSCTCARCSCSSAASIHADLAIAEALNRWRSKRRRMPRCARSRRPEAAAVAGLRLIGDPELLFLDEPTTGLDPQSRRQTWEIVEGLKARGRTVLLTTHYMEEAARLCDRVAILDHGKVIALGTPRELVASLGAEHVVEFTVDEGASNAVTAEILAALPSVEGVAREGGRWRLTVREVHRAVPALLGALAERGRRRRNSPTHDASLEDVFMALTGRRLRDG